ncbi:hypothetical protein KQX54_005392 [Cotesia glomerata]|uniref:Uncharacterized protein n=1 Tax=Cotesia glomerata TaxID=32391 RepID=A0AAV7II31_COTGL|nr:hypothetical protein KQX54_005392 [Cotesia glomerata]
MENFDIKAYNEEIMESIAYIDSNIDITKNPPTPGKTILKYFPEDYMRFNQPLTIRRELFVIEEDDRTEDTHREDQEELEDPENRQEEEITVEQPERINRAAQKLNFSVLPRDTRPIAIPKFRNVNRGVFFGNNQIDRTQTNHKKRICREEKTAPSLDSMEDKLKGVLEHLKSRPKKDVNQGKRKAMVIDVSFKL